MCHQGDTGITLRVVPGEDETRKRTAVVFALPFIIGLMLIQPVSADPVTVVLSDREGDLGKNWDYATCDAKLLWGRNTPLVRVGYFDMLSVWLSQEGNRFMFGMQLAADLPVEGTPLPYGFHRASWLMWIDSCPWNPLCDPIPSLFVVWLTYDGSSYAAELREYGTGVILETCPFTIEGSQFRLAFSATSIDCPEGFWWFPCTQVRWGPSGSSAFWDLDGPDPGAAPGQVYWDIPWP